MTLLDISLDTVEDFEVLSLNFPKGFRENAILWLVGVYVELVETEVILKGNRLSIASVKGIFKQRKQAAKYLALPVLGTILGLETEARGIG